MNAPGPHHVSFRATDVVAMVLVALGAVVFGGWMLDAPMTMSVGSERVGMTLNSAVSFILAGLALSFGMRPVRFALAVLLLIPSTLTLIEHSFGVNLFIDHLFGTSWAVQFAPHAGRMAPQVATSFALTALTFIQLTLPRSNRLNWLPPLATVLVFLAASISLLGPLLRLDIVYDWRHATRIAPHTAAGLLLLAIGLTQIVYRRSFESANDVSNDARRILTISTAAILAITITCAAMCFSVVVRHSHDVQRAALGRELHNQAELIAAEIASQRFEANRIMASQSLGDILIAESRSGPRATILESLEHWADRRLPLSRGLAAFELIDASGQSLLRWGTPITQPSITVPLDTDARIDIAKDARVTLERSLQASANSRPLAVRIQFSLPRLTAALQPEPEGSDVERAICFESTRRSARCLHLAGTPIADLPAARGENDATSAFQLAVSGQFGVTLGTEPNGAGFFAAYGPIDGTPLAMTFARPLETLYAELRSQLNVLLLLMMGLVAIGAWILRWQIVPLIAKVVAARSRASDSAMHLSAIMDTAGDGLITVNRIGTVLSANPAFHRLLDGDSRDPVGKNLTALLPGLELCPDEHGEKSLACWANRPALEFTRKREDGQALHLQVEFAWLDESTRSMLVATVRDLTLLKQGERELRETHERLQDSEQLHRDQATRFGTLFDTVEDAIVIIDTAGTIKDWNRGAQHLFGYIAEDIVGKDVRLLTPEPTASMPIEQFLLYVQSGERSHLGRRVEVDARHGSGRIVPVELSLREMVIEGKRLYSAVMRDISVRREVERMKSEFVSTISHELRTPLTSIAGSLTLISGGAAGEVPPKIARLVGIARQNSERLIRLINDILDLEKAEAGKLEFQFSVRSLRAEVASVAEFNRGFAQNLDVAIELENGDDAEVFIDSDRLTQVLTNLISNAAKFSPPGGTVRVRVEREDPGVRVTVSDNGPGIPAEFCSRIFQKFAQADASDSRAKGGTGLGLSIAKTITEKHAGRIGFHTAPGKGTSFYIILPMHGRTLDTRSAAAELPARLEEADIERAELLPRILHIEDDPSLTAIVRDTMSRNAVVTPARSIATARHLLETQHFDAIILDVGMPDGSGIDLLPDERRADEAGPVVVSYTADEPSRALRTRVDAALVKSRHSVTHLLATVLKQLEEKTARLAGERRLG
ncbi:MAG: ATP-binding protein [Steroidobacter sp.]